MPMTYTTLTGSKDTEGSIKYFVRHSKVPSTTILERAQDAIYSLLRVREMLTRTDGTIPLDASELTMPSGMLDPLALFRRGSYRGRIALFDQTQFEQMLGEDEDNALFPGTPVRATFDGTKFYFDCLADQDYPYRLWYIAKPAYLSASNETNFLTVRYPHVLEAMCKAYAWEERDDDQKANAKRAEALGFIERANAEFDFLNQALTTNMFWDSDER